NISCKTANGAMCGRNPDSRVPFFCTLYPALIYLSKYLSNTFNASIPIYLDSFHYCAEECEVGRPSAPNSYHQLVLLVYSSRSECITIYSVNPHAFLLGHKQT